MADTKQKAGGLCLLVGLSEETNYYCFGLCIFPQKARTAAITAIRRNKNSTDPSASAASTGHGTGPRTNRHVITLFGQIPEVLRDAKGRTKKHAPP